MTSLVKSRNSLLKTIKTTSLTFLASMMMAGTAFANANQGEAESFTTSLVQELGQIAQNDALGDSIQMDSFRDALKRRLAAKSIGKFLLKGVPADTITPQQLDTYNQLFPSYIASAFASQIGGLAERQINVTQSRARGENEVIVRSELVNKKGIKKASIDWRIRWINAQPRLLDVLVERSSPLVSKRQEFSSLAKREGFDAVLAHMKSVAK